MLVIQLYKDKCDEGGHINFLHAFFPAKEGVLALIDMYSPSGIISVRTIFSLSRLRSSMVEQLTLNQLVEGSNPPGVIKFQSLRHKIICLRLLSFKITKSRTFASCANVRDEK